MASYDLADELAASPLAPQATMKVAIVNLGQIVSGDWRNPFAAGRHHHQRRRAHRLGRHRAGAGGRRRRRRDRRRRHDGDPGLIDSHVHITFGDYTPRQRTVGYLESYVHGGVTTAISASEVHVPGRPRDVEGVKALAVAAQRCFADYRPGGMRVIAGSVILEPGLKAGFQGARAEGRAAGQGRLRRGARPPTTMCRWSPTPRRRA